MSNSLPNWITTLIETEADVSPEQAMTLSVDIALASAQNQGGPFGAVLLDGENRIVTVGWNNVVLSKDSTAHAEIDCLRRAQQLLGSHDLKALGQFTLYSSTAPCIQCFGAIWWAGVAGVSIGAPRESAEDSGFMEGPVSDELWEEATKLKGIKRTILSVPGLDTIAPFKEFERLGGVLY
jgi:tRNA(Arg) A34 adenosine deaminase TadA